MKHMKFSTLFLFCAFASPTLAEDAPANGHRHKPGMQHGDMYSETLPSEAGQSAFAAIQEIVAKLEADPATDWSKVNIEALRQHLIDMDAVTLNAMVQTEQRPDGLKFFVSGDGRVVLSIQRVLTGHAETMNGKDGWTFTAETNATGATLTVKPANAADMAKLDGLGFIGIMTRGMHHQQHHWMMATGLHPH